MNVTCGTERFMLPFHGDGDDGALVSQGVALGWYIAAPAGQTSGPDANDRLRRREIEKAGNQNLRFGLP